MRVGAAAHKVARVGHVGRVQRERRGAGEARELGARVTRRAARDLARTLFFMDVFGSRQLLWRVFPSLLTTQFREK